MGGGMILIITPSSTHAWAELWFLPYPSFTHGGRESGLYRNSLVHPRPLAHFRSIDQLELQPQTLLRDLGITFGNSEDLRNLLVGQCLITNGHVKTINLYCHVYVALPLWLY